MKAIKNPTLARQHGPLTLLLAVSLGLASGCAQIPRLDPPPAMKGVGELGSSTSLAAPRRGLAGRSVVARLRRPCNSMRSIEEALHDAPDLEIAQARLRPRPLQSQGAGRRRACPR